MCLLTRSTSELRGTSQVNDPTSTAYQRKKVRRFFLLCIILFCTDGKCSMPLHTLLADSTESQGGSTLLLRLLNRLGVCASADTLARFIQFKVTNFSSDKLKHLKPDGFATVSADNIDFLHSCAHVFCRNHISSWHGTSVQAVQPLPLSINPHSPCMQRFHLSHCIHDSMHEPQTQGHDPPHCSYEPLAHALIPSLISHQTQTQGHIPFLILHEPQTQALIPSHISHEPHTQGHTPSVGSREPQTQALIPSHEPQTHALIPSFMQASDSGPHSLTRFT